MNEGNSHVTAQRMLDSITCPALCFSWIPAATQPSVSPPTLPRLLEHSCTTQTSFCCWSFLTSAFPLFASTVEDICIRSLTCLLCSLSSFFRHLRKLLGTATATSLLILFQFVQTPPDPGQSVLLLFHLLTGYWLVFQREKCHAQSHTSQRCLAPTLLKVKSERKSLLNNHHSLSDIPSLFREADVSITENSPQISQRLFKMIPPVYAG